MKPEASLCEGLHVAATLLVQSASRRLMLEGVVHPCFILEASHLEWRSLLAAKAFFPPFRLFVASSLEIAASLSLICV